MGTVLFVQVYQCYQRGSNSVRPAQTAWLKYNTRNDLKKALNARINGKM